MVKSVSLEVQRLVVLGLLLLWCTTLIVLRVERTDSLQFAFLWWNLLLAYIPLLASSALRATHLRGLRLMQIILFGLWLLFLPNAPYILTDLIHLVPRPAIPLWYDLALLLSCAGTGLFLGYLSLIDVHTVVEQKFGRPVGWAVALGSLLLCGFGIYLGRFLRWNSWEALTNPFGLFRDIAERILNPYSDPRTLAVTLIFGLALVLGYTALHSIAASPPLAAPQKSR